VTMHPAPEVEAVDTTGAGDVFNGVLAAELARGAALRGAVDAAVAVAAASVTRPGARQPPGA
jgi:ribokinase